MGQKLKVLDLFSGIGGFSLGLERTGGFETVAFCEIDPFCRRVLAKHWPDVPCFEDVTTLRGESVGTVDVICGGFPCQDISVAGLGAGMDGARSGLWTEFRRLIRELRPAFVLVENVSALLNRGLDRVLGDLAALGYDAEWHCIPASAVGAPHIRDRVWIVAYPHGDDDRGEAQLGTIQRSAGEGQAPEQGADWEWYWRGFSDGCQTTHAAHANSDGLQERKHVSGPGGTKAGSEQVRGTSERVSAPSESSHAEQGQRPLGRQAGRVGRLVKSLPWHGDWPLTAEPVLDRGVDGLPAQLDRIRKQRCGALGNAVVPQIPELLGNAILQSMKVAA